MKIILVLLAIGFVLACGCTTAAPSGSATQATQAIAPSAAPTLDQPGQKSEPISSQFPAPKYVVGDIIAKEGPYYIQGFMVAGYNETTGKYRRVELNRWNYGNGRYGNWSIVGGNRWEDLDATTMEGSYRKYLGHIENHEIIIGIIDNSTSKRTDVVIEDLRKEVMKQRYCSESNDC